MNTIVPKPSKEQVNLYLNKWDNLENYSLQEDSLDKLFFELCPNNTSLPDILIKCSCLNDFYSTNIYSIYDVGKHIYELNIDNRLHQGDLNLVNDIADVTIKNKNSARSPFLPRDFIQRISNAAISAKNSEPSV